MAAEVRASSCYVDTSALVKRYMQEAGSEAFDKFCAESGLDMLICPLGSTEFVGVLQRRVRGKQLSARQSGVISQRFLADVAAGGWRLIEFGADVFAEANNLILHLGAPLGTLDALHLACALQHGADELATGDRQLATAARKARLRVHLF
ncbi:MAG: type II toxin-antitoxin system VapC family toxin [Burkholderiaceae bacterium]